MNPIHQSPSDKTYPRARIKQEATRGDIIKPCLHCGQEIAVKRWDSWNGFLVQCPKCSGLHGKRWDIRRVLFGSFLFHAFSFLFTLRPGKASLALLGFAVVAVTGNYLIDREQIPDILEIVGVLIFGLGPMIVNAVILIKHERDLDNSARPTGLSVS